MMDIFRPNRLFSMKNNVVRGKHFKVWRAMRPEMHPEK